MINHKNIKSDVSNVTISASEFSIEHSEKPTTREYHLMFTLDSNDTNPTVQLEKLLLAYQATLTHLNLSTNSNIIRRLFCSDPSNQASLIANSPLSYLPGAFSVVGQAPISAGKFSLWAYHIKDATPLQTEQIDDTFILHRDTLSHFWSAALTAPMAGNSYQQSQAIFNHYSQFLEQNQMNWLDHVQRTWFIVRDVDNNYQGLVDARNHLFEAQSLTKDTHFITSTGIDGNALNTDTLVYFDSLAIKGLLPGQVQFLSAPEFLNATHEYGVAFERGTAIHYQDRSHIYLSGTASIDHQGEIVHEGDVMQQLERTLININALLAEANASVQDMAHWIVYLRDHADAAMIKAALRKRFPNAPMVFVRAPVCRPGWLIEIEGIAVVENSAPEFPRY